MASNDTKDETTMTNEALRAEIHKTVISLQMARIGGTERIALQSKIDSLTKSLERSESRVDFFNRKFAELGVGDKVTYIE